MSTHTIQVYEDSGHGKGIALPGGNELLRIFLLML